MARQKEDSPCFQFYPRDYLSSSRVAQMTLEQEGAYIRLLAAQWLDGSIPASVPALARMCKSTARAMQRLWDGWTEEKTQDVVPGLSECFVSAPGLTGRLINERLEHERAEQKARKRERAESGKRGARARWVDGSAMAQPSVTDSTTPANDTPEPLAKDGLSFSSSLSFASSPSAHSPAASESDDSGWLNGFEQIWAAAPLGMKECGEPAAQHACFIAFRHGTLRVDGAPPPARGRSRTVSEVVVNLAAWERSRRWQEGFRPHLDKFLQQARFLVDPAPEPVRIDDRRGAGAHADAQPSRVRKVGS